MAGNNRVARISQRGGGAFFEVCFNCKRTWPEFSFGFNWIEANSERFSAKIEWSPKKKSSPKFRAFFCQLTPTSTSHFTIFGGLFSIGGGAISRFRAKNNLKTAKSMLFCILFRPMRGAIAPFAPPSYATGWKDACCSQSIFHTTSLRWGEAPMKNLGLFRKK